MAHKNLSCSGADKNEKDMRKYIAIDETKLEIGSGVVYIWAARDVQTREILALKVTTTRTSRMASEFISFKFV